MTAHRMDDDTVIQYFIYDTLLSSIEYSISIYPLFWCGLLSHLLLVAAAFNLCVKPLTDVKFFPERK